MTAFSKDSSSDPLDGLAEEFVQRYQRGERPPLSEYTSRHPELAEEIRELFPALVLLQNAQPRHNAATGSFDGAFAGPSGAVLERVGDYRILREVGRGGMGIVYEATQESLGRHVAVKVLAMAAHLDDSKRERFRREACAAAKLHHTNIVPVFGVGEDQGLSYYVMQFINGQGLNEVLAELRQLHRSGGERRPNGEPRGVSPPPPLAMPASSIAAVAESLWTGRFEASALEFAPPPEQKADTLHLSAGSATTAPSGPRAKDRSTLTDRGWRYCQSVARIGAQVAGALAYAHSQGILHRDVKPSNLLLDTRGCVWVADFGLAKLVAEDDPLTQSGDIVGTVRYMAPERFKGQSDVRCDIYSLGLTLYEMLTFTPAFDDKDRHRILEQVMSAEPPRPRLRNPDVPRDLETIVLKAMDKDPGHRYQTAQEMAEDLERFIEDRPIQARPVTRRERLWRWCRRNPAIAALIGAVAVLLMALTVGSLGTAVWLNQSRNEVIAAETDVAEKLYESLVAQANASRFSRRVGQRFDTLDAVGKAAELVRQRHMPAERLDGLRNLAIAALTLPDFRTLRTLAEYPPDTEWAADDHLRLYALRSLLSREGLISLRRVDTDQEIAHLEGGGNLGFSPGGRFFLAYGDGRFRAWDLSGLKPRLLWEDKGHGFAFHPDGRHLLVSKRDGSLLVYDLEAPSEKPSFLVTLQPPADILAFDPKGNRLAVVRAGKAQILDAKTGKLAVPIAETQPVEWVAWHPSGNYLALVCSPHDIHLWDLKRMSRGVDLTGCRGGAVNVAFTPDGNLLLSQGWEGIVRLWDWRTGGQVLQQKGTDRSQFSRDGRLLIEQAHRFSLVAVAGGNEYRSFTCQSARGKDIALWAGYIHPQGRLAAVAMSDCVRLFDLETGDEVAEVPQTNFRIAFQSDGALLTNGNRGLLRWPIHEAGPGRLQVGPPELLDPRSFIDMASDRNGAVIGQATGNGAFLTRPGKGTAYLGPHGGAQHISISPDGDYAATGVNDGEEGVKLWDTKTRRLLRHFPVGRHCGALFSPDGKWLAIWGAQGGQVVKVGTWEIVANETHTMSAFSADGTLFAAASRQGVIRLIELPTWRELARLEDPNQAFGSITFTPDGAKLLTCADHDRSMHVWDLRSIRDQLASLGLDWDAPPFPKAERVTLGPLQVTVILGDLFVDDRVKVALSSFRLALNPYDFEAYFERGRVYGRRKEHQKAVADYSMALTLMPGTHESRAEVLLLRRSSNYRTLKDQVRADADLEQLAELDLSKLPEALRDAAAQECNNLAWRCATGLEKQRDPKKALFLAQKAVKLNPDTWVFLNTLGVAHYRLGQYQQAADTFERSLREGQGQADAFDLFFLAMCHHKLGDAAKAKECYDRATAWFEQRRGNMPANYIKELTEFQGESKELLAATAESG